MVGIGLALHPLKHIKITQWKVSMNCTPPAIPHLVVSTKQTIEKHFELHVLTSLGQLDISFYLPPMPGTDSSRLDILVEGDTAFWLLERALRKATLDFVGKLALRYSGWPLDRPCELRIRLRDDFSGDINLKGRLMPYVSATGGG
jgi:hypothetical protein